ncbi:cytochrome C oxidase subunit IV family protein [Aliicoccus persicus]|uniref:Cytochrome c oxidase subunit 4 n=1 Tax=Aliicoccus persicus TaxID=930138 RepID=A0A662Z045_9STAP|nr:cytochrome C oxidase subunit IV family protein [Aliicoccus persicus]SEV80394.1 cytochrome c oxidase subunit 4 [Aliicoccus persicus]
MAELNQKPLTDVQLKQRKLERKIEMRHHVTSFSLMIFLTFAAFAMVALELDPLIITAAVIVMALVQVILQFYYFMHMKDKGHGFIRLFMLVGMYFAIAFVLCYVLIVWIGLPIGSV